MTERIRDALVVEEIAAQAGTDQPPDLFLSDVLQPVIFGPQRPPLAASGYFPGCMGLTVAKVALNTSHAGLFVSGTNADVIVRVNSISIINGTGGGLQYTIRRLDDASGFTIVGLVPGYISAGLPASGAVFSAIRSNTVPASGALMATVRVAAESKEDFAGPWIVNNGAIIVAGGAVDTEVRVYINYEHWPSIRRQPIVG